MLARRGHGRRSRRRRLAAPVVADHDLSFTRRVYIHLDAEDGPDATLLDDLAGCAPARIAASGRLRGVLDFKGDRLRPALEDGFPREIAQPARLNL